MAFLIGSHNSKRYILLVVKITGPHPPINSFLLWSINLKSPSPLGVDLTPQLTLYFRTDTKVKFPLSVGEGEFEKAIRPDSYRDAYWG